MQGEGKEGGLERERERREGEGKDGEKERVSCNYVHNVTVMYYYYISQFFFSTEPYQDHVGLVPSP